MNLPINSEEYNIEDMKPRGEATKLAAFFGVQKGQRIIKYNLELDVRI
jgi:hypothetical protein